jgi:hypothetical protein
MKRARQSGGCSRQFHWVSSVAGNAELLSKLHCEMSQFYGERDRRQRYQEMLEQQDDSPAETSVRHLMPKYICDLEPGRILEVGCGDGRLYRQLRARRMETELAYLCHRRRRSLRGFVSGSQMICHLLMGRTAPGWKHIAATTLCLFPEVFKLREALIR